jgi:hypothetical protein
MLLLTDVEKGPVLGREYDQGFSTLQQHVQIMRRVVVQLGMVLPGSVVATVAAAAAAAACAVACAVARAVARAAARAVALGVCLYSSFAHPEIDRLYVHACQEPRDAKRIAQQR